MKKLILFLMLMHALAGATVAYSNELAQLVIHAVDGTQVSYILSQQPRISFTSTDIIVTSNDVEISYERLKIAKFTYEILDFQEGITNLLSGQKSFEIVDNTIIFSHLQANSVVNIYSIDGSLILHNEISSSGEYMFPLKNISEGVYLVNVNSLTYKFLLK